MERLVVPQGEFTLDRHPIVANDPLRAWDAADGYLLRRVAGEGGGVGGQDDPAVDLTGPVLIVNDAFGAISTALALHRPWALSDSYLARVATRRNLQQNGVADADGDRRWLSSLEPPPDPVDVVLIKVPKSLALLEDQLHRIRPSLHADTRVIGAAMAKHIHASTLELFEQIIGPTRTSPADKKARLIYAEPDLGLRPAPSPWPRSFTCHPGDHQVISHAGVFSGERLDVGTRFFLETLPKGSGPEHIVDLGCGNGVVGMMSAVRNPRAEVTFIDESYRAVASAEATFRANLGDERAARFVVGNILADLATGEPLAAGTVDRVLNNPPFHVDRAVGDAVAWQMFVEAREVLAPEGELWVIGNRHLAYHAKLRRLFGNCDTVASNAKFVVLRSTR
jgi:23S rRNA (guanine1835-N2)-methyltransferase